MLNKSRVWSLQLVSFLIGLKNYQHLLVLFSLQGLYGLLHGELRPRFILPELKPIGRLS
jgi:hypothetical protein